MSPSTTTDTPKHVPSSQRCEPGSINVPIAKWPKTATDGPIDALAVAKDIFSSFNSNLAKLPSQQAASDIISLFRDEGCYWRDHLALSWDLRTLKNRDKIAAFLADNASLEEVAVDTSTEFRSPKVGAFNPEQTVKGIVVYLTLSTRLGRGRGLAKLAQDGGGGWKIWTLFTGLEELKGFEEPVGRRRPTGVAHGYHRGRKNWLDRRREEEDFVNGDPDVLILGAGQAGLTAHARLKMLNVPTLIVDANASVGDNWRQRYHQLVLHDPVWYDHMPYIPFPDSWPIFTPKDKLGDFFESYAKLLELNVWTRSTVEAASWDEREKRWTITVKRTVTDGQGGEETHTRTLRPKHIIQSTGHSGKPNLPAIPGIETFQGDFLGHSSAFPGARPDGAGRKAVVIGACNSAHDICQDYHEKGYAVTMVQRSSTCVVSSSSICRISLKGDYEEGGPPTEDSDLAGWATPAEVLKAVHREVCAAQQAHDAETLQGLRKAGFAVDKGPDECGLYLKYFQRGGGYYIDVGASQLIADGSIAVKQGQEVVEVLPHGLRFADGTELEADEIVFATGYQNMRTQARAIFGDEVADKLGDIWGFDEEGEFRALWRNSGHPGFWFHGGNLAICRYYSRVVALQIKAQLEGLA
ncbi:FAD/NAD(P)-binding domain-containing protein [Cryphonectria parasitica EP155]|uniref:FAD/NAD(P)-binding domain-containing protein n=1 Tax=Cryphonectria parasitica (strain ATCC 38755 / EP155) TaxID=660469 RepID=A0A9P4XZ77_CRYP1|nr:FAD/NAD(P)-binding domain-containing protein [Cryphonectria parasitica EP155]KAF3763245.1 FAD/NAD(P)-binding domain-containing protein [Cryphonectria parasitica EP155]